MSDLLLLAGVLLCLLSLPLAVIQLVRLQPPRAAVLALVGGIVLIFAGAATNPDPFRVQDIPAALGRVTGN
jgi:peptidoglycan/LPS O-acetylase OafA/YrhL